MKIKILKSIVAIIVIFNASLLFTVNIYDHSKKVVSYVRDSKFAIPATTINIASGSLKHDSSQTIAHRGLSELAPENSIPAFTLATSNEFWGIEADFWETLPDPLTNTTEIVCSHDPNLLRMTGVQKEIRYSTYNEIKDITIKTGSNIDKYSELKLPTFEEYLDVIKPHHNIHPVIHIKNNALTISGCNKMLNALNARGMLGRAIISSSSQTVLSNFEKGIPEIKTMLILESSFQKKFPQVEQAIKWAKTNNVEVILLHKKICSKTIIKKIKAEGLKVGVWTLKNKDKEYKLAFDSDVDFIMSNNTIHI